MSDTVHCSMSSLGVGGGRVERVGESGGGYVNVCL